MSYIWRRYLWVFCTFVRKDKVIKAQLYLRISLKGIMSVIKGNALSCCE